MRRVRRKGGNKEKVFGCDLLEHLTASSQQIPQVLQCCGEFVETHGIVDGIYRLSGVSSNIQKLRGEFESDGTPDLNKDLYLQDIHCVSSLCKAYFRELPNPLLTYQLYDKFAEAVAIQLEEDRLVKIRDVLKELPEPHHRTLQFLMRHLVKMASFSSETNMHSRNLAIVWAPNLLRSKDIEASGFNGTAAFMEVRVQSIVVEFILTHVPQLFPEEGWSNERRKSLPSPAPMLNQDDGFFKTAHPFPNFGQISPGDGPLPIRPYHAIIEGTDKRKGSLKGRKWMSIFNIGGRFHDPRRKNKHSTKEKERPALRPARSMDSLSTPSYPHEGSRRTAQRPPSTNMSPIVTSSAQSGAEVTASTGALGGSEYAVTYRRGTGLVSGGSGTQGTYTCLDPEGLGLSDNETLQSRSPGISSKGRRAAMHITGPTLVTVPLHITSNLALGVLQGGGGDRVIHRARDRDGADRVEGQEGGEKMRRRESRGVERKVEESRRLEEEEKATDGGEVEEAGGSEGAGGGGEEAGKGKEEEEEEEEEEEVVEESGPMGEARGASGERRAASRTSDTEGDGVVEDDDDVDEYMDMNEANRRPEATQRHDDDDRVFDAPDILHSTVVEEEDQELSCYVQDNFDFLDHMDCSAPYQVSEFSVEPPGHSDDEYEVMEQPQLAEPRADAQPAAAAPTTQSNPHRHLSIDSQGRHTKSLSLPHMASPVFGSNESCSEEEAAVEDSDDNDYSSEEDESMFVKSLPCSFFTQGSPFDTDPDERGGGALAPERRSGSPEEEERPTVEVDSSACEESTAGDQEQIEVEDEGDEEGLRGKEQAEQEEEDTQENQSQATAEDVLEDSQSDEEQPLPPPDFPPPGDDQSAAAARVDVEDEADAFGDHRGGCPPSRDGPGATQSDAVDVPSEGSRDSAVAATGQPAKERDGGEDRQVNEEAEDTCPETLIEVKVSGGDAWEGGGGVIAERGGDEEPHGAICGELEDAVACEGMKVEESEQTDGEGDTMKDASDGGEDAPAAKGPGEEMLESDKEGGSAEVAEESSAEAEEKLAEPETQPQFEENEAKTSEGEGGKPAASDRAQHHQRVELVLKERERHDEDKDRADKQPQEVRGEASESMEGRKWEESGRGGGGVGRKLVISKHPKVYQAKAVPVVPPKPQHCKITAMSLRQQQQQQQQHGETRGENTARVAAEWEKVCAGDGEDEGRGRKESASRNSPLSMCFDEAVAIATMRREKEKECGKEKERQRGNEAQ
uniref:Si:dkeyp-68b7.12 n=1 Tax=Gasterosteus aculeatus aculeatus TaxID=481459 RepID=A0AAQ4PMJ7_GASAC